MRGSNCHRLIPSLLIVAGAASAGPIISNTALPVHDGELIVRQQAIWMRAAGNPGAVPEELDVLAAPAVLVYGLNADLMLMGILPFFYKNVAVTLPSGRATRHTTGFGDLTAIGRYTVLALDAPGRTFRIAPFTGLKVPTGAQDEADALGRYPPVFQLGTGSWDPLAGAVVTWQTLRWELDASGTYQLRTEANGFRAGNEARGDASFQYRLVPWGKLGPGVPSYLFAVLEAAAVWSGRDRLGGADDPDSGGFAWYLTSGLQWISLRTVLEGGVQLPVVQRRNGRGLRNDFVAVLSFRQSF